MKLTIAFFLLWSCSMSLAQASREGVEIKISITNTPKPISPDLFGIFFEDLNYAADGGLYAELIQNRSFDYQATEQLSWNANSFWEVVTRGGGKGGINIDGALPIHANNPRYVVLHVNQAGEGVGLANPGFDGIAVKAGEQYNFSFFARQLYMNARWGADSAIEGKPMPVTVCLEDKEGKTLAEASLEITGREWKKISGTLTPNQTETAARFVIYARARGGIALDEISLFPQNTFRGRKNGLRADLAQTIADLKPRFMRFPGGCLVHGSGLSNFYRWKDTIGPVETRRGQYNIWGYHQSVGLGYFEFFQFCEDIGAMPLPVVPAGVSCQNSGHTSGVGQQCLPMEDMPAYIQEILDLIEWANGPVTSTWGAKRAAAGHPEPFNLKYLGVGNEDHITPGFKERFAMIYKAIKEKHPEIVVIGTTGPSHRGFDYEEGWKLANELQLPMVDEHYYVSPDWFWDNLNFYDRYDRSRSKVYLGEYAAHDVERKSTLRSALAEAAYMTALERNGDIVHFASYAPLLAKHPHTQWRPDLIYFDNTRICRTINYQVQQLFSVNAGDRYLPVKIDREVSSTEKPRETFAASCVEDSKTGEVILKLVTRAETITKVEMNLSSLGEFQPQATRILLSGEAMAENTIDRQDAATPISGPVEVTPNFTCDLPPHSLTIIRLKRQR